MLVKSIAAYFSNNIWVIRRFLILPLIITLCLHKNASSQNLIVNGSMTSIKGADVVAPGWSKFTNSNSNTPDVNDNNGPLITTDYYTWDGGLPIASPDGGTWQNVFNAENFTQTISGLTIGATYYFRYYYASQGIFAGAPAPEYTYPFPPVVKIDGAIGYSDPLAGQLFQWNTYFGALVATSSSITITASQGNNDGYMAFDGFYLGTASPEQVLITGQPSSDTICNGGTADLEVQAVPGVTFQWQIYNGIVWTDLVDGTNYQGSLTNKLHVQNADSSMNANLYRCFINSSCCSQYSFACTITVFPIATPSITIVPEASHACAGDTVSFKASSTSAGPLPIYQWQKNGIGVGADTDIYTDGNLSRGDVISCVLTSRSPCALPRSATSNLITVVPCINGFHVPSAFTPNNDGKNDRFSPLIYQDVDQYNFTVFNRWGEVVFHSEKVGESWDGTAHGVKQSADVYAWLCSYQIKGDTRKTAKGTVMLIR